MPISRENAARYPKDWNAISRRIRERAGDRCECRGECGLEHGSRRVLRRGSRETWFYDDRCAVPNGTLIARQSGRPERWELSEDHDWPLDEIDHDWKAVRVVLTVAHMNHTPEDCRPSNLKAMCQLCHNRYDREHRNSTAATTRHSRRATGDLFGARKQDGGE